MRWLFVSIPVLACCAGGPTPRPATSGPSSPAAQEAPPAEIDAFSTGPKSLTDPLLPQPAPGEPKAHEGHEGHGTP